MAAASVFRASWTRSLFKLNPTSFWKPTSYQNIAKTFSTTAHRNMLSSELSEADVSALRVNKERLAKDLHDSCQWGFGIRWGEYV